MKFNQFLSILAFSLAFVGPMKGMSYFRKLTKSQSVVNTIAVQIEQLQFDLADAIQSYDYVSALKASEEIFRIADTTQKEKTRRVITRNILSITEALIGSRSEDHLKNLIHNFIKPAITLDPALLENIFSMINENFDQFIRSHSSLAELRIYLSLFDTSKALDFFFNKLDKLEKLAHDNDLRISDFTAYMRYTIRVAGLFTFIEHLLKNFQELAEKKPYALTHIFKILPIAENEEIIRTLDRKSYMEHLGKEISDAIFNNFIFICNHEKLADVLILNPLNLAAGIYHSHFLTDITYTKVIQKTIELIQQINPIFVAKLLEKTGDSELAKAIISSNHFSDAIKSEAIIFAEPQFSPTRIHLKQYLPATIKYHTQEFKTNNEVKHLFNDFLKKEHELNKESYFTFIHGQRRELYFIEKLYTHLWGIRKKQPVDNFLFAHVKDLVETEDDQYEQDIMRQCIQANGTQVDSYDRGTDITRRKLVLFMNYTFFANISNPGSHTPGYILSNQNSLLGNSVEFTAQEPFNKLGYEWIYAKYKNEIEELTNDYKNLCQYGNALLIAVPKEKVNEYVYLAKSGGPRESIMIDGVEQMHNTRLILDTLINNPEKIKAPYPTATNPDKIEFCLIMTQKDGGLDPSTGIQVHPLLSGDPEKLKVLKQREDALFAKIKTDIEEYEKQQHLNRAQVIANHIAQSSEAKSVVPAQAMGRMQKIVNHLNPQMG